MNDRRPTRAELLAANGRTITDVIAPNLRVLFCGINPGLYSGVTGHHFARPGNRFWPTLHAAGFTPRQLAPREEQVLLRYDLGITNLVARTTATAAELTDREMIDGRAALEGKVRQYQPRWIAILGVTAYRTGWQLPKAMLGPQPEVFGGARVWVLPNPSGLNAHYQRGDLARVYGELREAVEREA
jgi:double-stranded uracil-DNA glycosylase